MFGRRQADSQRRAIRDIDVRRRRHVSGGPQPGERLTSVEDRAPAVNRHVGALSERERCSFQGGKAYRSISAYAFSPHAWKILSISAAFVWVDLTSRGFCFMRKDHVYTREGCFGTRYRWRLLLYQTYLSCVVCFSCNGLLSDQATSAYLVIVCLRRTVFGC